MKLRAIVTTAAVVMALVAGPASAGPDGSVDLFFVNQGVVDFGACQGNALFVPFQFGTIQLSMQVRLAGATAGGISGVEGFLEVSNPLPAGWSGSMTPFGTAIATGDWFNISDPNNDGTFDTFRGNLVFQGVTGPLPENGCQVGIDGIQQVGTVGFANFAAPAANIPFDTWVTVVPSDPASNPLCPGLLIATLCDSPVFTAVCITGGSFLINPSTGSCAVAVEETTWGGIKDLYR